MRVAFVSPWTTHRRETPVTRRTRRTARLLAERGHEVTVLCARWWEGHLPAFTHDGVEYRAVGRDTSGGRFGSRLPVALARFDPDVIQVVASPASLVVTTGVAGTLLRTPVVADWWAADDSASGRTRRLAVRAADAVVTPSRTVKTQIREHGAAEAAVHVIPDPVDYDLIRESSVDDRADVVYARDLDADANVESFLLALAELRDRDWRAAVVGDGPARADAEQTARDLRIDDRVAFLGALPVEERVPILKGAHVFAQTATREAFATNLLWALACGCVGIVEYQAGSSAHELVEGRERGYRVTSPQELADEIVAAGEVPHSTVGEAFTDYDEFPVLEQYLDCYRDVLADRGLF
jgi:glycosyltransferase involved in cell wall biosynthesis